MQKQQAALRFCFNGTFFIKTNLFFKIISGSSPNSRRFCFIQIVSSSRWSWKLWFFFNRKVIFTYSENMEEEARHELTDNDISVRPNQKGTKYQGIKTPGVIERFPLDTGQWGEIYVQMKVIYAHLLHRRSLFITNKWAHLMYLVSIQILNMF